jgi:ubiquinone/menaquinone biosynthesis C-methylase UbiE
MQLLVINAINQNLFGANMSLEQTANQPALSVKDKVRIFWNSSPCGTYKADEMGLKEGTLEYFKMIDEFRFTRRPYNYEYIPPFAGFSTSKGKKVLEIGCSVGTDLSQFALNGADVTGIDLTPKGIELAKKRFELYGLKGDLRVADAETLPFPDNTFDVVYSIGVLHHTPDTERAINQEVFRVLKPGGQARIGLYHKMSYNYLFLVYKAFRRRYLWKYSFDQRINLLTEGNKDPNGPQNPLTKIYTKRQARKFFTNFKDVNVETRWLNLWIPMPRFLHTYLDRKFGWMICITATK